MSVRKRVKKLVLPLFGKKEEPARAGAPRPKPVARKVYEEPKSPRGDAEPKAWIDEQVKGHKLVLFMKGSPLSPSCGFSANAAGILKATGFELHHVDVLLDGDVREAVKDYSEWPTIPQIFIDGEFVGGSDILTEMNGNGELQQALEEAFAE
ncbi:MAG: Grx4 family monothiol glutaredoxin [Proteobacteria bacterium]|nr:Grx4 family monothiol glutaredoxin [Pseudomonadota bacterium]MCP4917084.1 Grx4 family monothiol glutaredoxin [Pseudomonadota bacterium]